MQVKDLIEDGRIVKGVNTTVDVGTNEIPKQARKFGFKVDKDGRPPTLSRKVKGKSTNVLYNLGLAESVQINEAIQLWPVIAAVFTALAKKKGVSKAKAIITEFFRRIPPGTSPEVVLDLFKYLVGGSAGGYVATQVAKNKKQDKEEVKENVNSQSEIFVDMDGVLADFFGDWKKLVGKDWRNITDIKPALQKIRDTEDFWLNLPVTNNAKNLLGLIKDIKGSYNILSSPLPDDPNSEPHKRQWIEKHLSFFPPKDVIITFDKAKYAKQDDGTPNILIDDYGVNIGKWEAAGGMGFKHKDHKFERTARNLKTLMKESIKENKYADLGHKKPKNLDVDLKLPNGDKKVLRADDKDHIRGLVVRSNADGSYDSYYWYNDPTRKVPIEITIDGKSVSKNAKNIHWKFHPELNEENMSKKDIKKAHKKADKMLDSPKAKKSIGKWAKDKGMDPEGAIYAIAMNRQKKESYTRDQLPQIKNSNLQNIRHTIEKVEVKNLIPVQQERIMENFKKQVDRLVAGKYNYIVVDCDNKIVNGHHRLDALKMLNIREVEVARLPYTIKTIVENFADGKKKGKSRQGRVKRSGASCKGSVTSLRKKAKNASGEKQKMYHWCANMKSGRKK